MLVIGHFLHVREPNIQYLMSNYFIEWLLSSHTFFSTKLAFFLFKCFRLLTSSSCTWVTLIRKQFIFLNFCAAQSVHMLLKLPVNVWLAFGCRRGGDEAALHPVFPGQPVRTDHPTRDHREPESHLLSASLQGRTGYQLPGESGQEHQGVHALKTESLQQGPKWLAGLSAKIRFGLKLLVKYDQRDGHAHKSLWACNCNSWCFARHDKSSMFYL